MRLQEEIRELEQRFAQAPDSRLFLPLADALKRAGELERAAKLCREGLQRYPDFNSASILLGETLAELGVLDEAGKVLEQAAARDSGNERILSLLATMTGSKDSKTASSDGESTGSATVDKPGEEQVETELSGTQPDEQEQADDAPDKLNSEAGEMFITHTLGDIYRMQGHEQKALEVYRKLLDEGRGDPELKRKADELAGKLMEGQAETEPAGPEVVEQKERVSQEDVVVPPSGEGPFEDRVDAIFHFLLGDSPEHDESSAPAAMATSGAKQSGSGDFVDMLEDWIVDLKQGM